MGSFKVKLVVYFLLLSLLPLAAAFWGFSTVAARSETRRVDARLQAGLRATLATYQDELRAGDAAAQRLARDPQFQRALLERDRAALTTPAQRPAGSGRRGIGRLSRRPPLRTRSHARGCRRRRCRLGRDSCCVSPARPRARARPRDPVRARPRGPRRAAGERQHRRRAAARARSDRRHDRQAGHDLARRHALPRARRRHARRAA